MSKFLTEQRLRAIFSDFDTGRKGKLTPENLLIAFKKLGKEVTLDEVKAMIRQHDAGKDGGLDFEEFRAVFFDDKSKS